MIFETDCLLVAAAKLSLAFDALRLATFRVLRDPRFHEYTSRSICSATGGCSRSCALQNPRSPAGDKRRNAERRIAIAIECSAEIEILTGHRWPIGEKARNTGFYPSSPSLSLVLARIYKIVRHGLDSRAANTFHVDKLFSMMLVVHLWTGTFLIDFHGRTIPRINLNSARARTENSLCISPPIGFDLNFTTRKYTRASCLCFILPYFHRRTYVTNPSLYY